MLPPLVKFDETILLDAFDHLVDTVQSQSHELSAVFDDALKGEYWEALDIDCELQYDPMMGNTINYYEDFLEESRSFVNTLLDEFKICSLAASKLNAFDECRIDSDILIGDDDDDDFSDPDDTDDETLS